MSTAKKTKSGSGSGSGDRSRSGSNASGGSSTYIRMGDTFDETAFSRLLQERRFVTHNEIESCRIQQQELLDDGVKVSLADLLVQNGYVTHSQLSRLTQQDMDDSMSRPAQQIPGYQILGKLGAGAMAAVYKAKQIKLDRIVAIKVLPKRLSENREFVDRFYKEGQAAASLNHPNIVQAIDVGEASGYHYFVMEYIDGHTVHDDLNSDRPYSEKEALNIIVQVSRALEHAHSRGFIHRDVKPKNIMITKDGMVKLADLGLAREVADVRTAKAEAGRAYGTPYYISPEQIRGELDIDFRADVYSLGATFYQMVTRRLPFEAATPSAVMHKHLKEPLIPPDHINTKLSSGVGEIIEVMMAKDRTKRYASTRDLLVDLESIVADGAPLQARQRVDDKMLQQLADGGETVTISNPSVEEMEITPPNWTLVIALMAILGISVIINIILLVKD